MVDWDILDNIVILRLYNGIYHYVYSIFMQYDAGPENLRHINDVSQEPPGVHPPEIPEPSRIGSENLQERYAYPSLCLLINTTYPQTLRASRT